MRVAAAGFSDTVELTRSGAQWFASDREPVELDFLMSSAHAVRSVSPSMTTRVAQAAGSAPIQ